MPVAARFQTVVTAISVREGDAVDLGEEGADPLLIGPYLAGKAEGQHGTAVEGPLKGDDRRTLGVGTGDLNGVLYGLGAAVEQDGLLGEVAGGYFVQPFRQLKVGFIEGDHEAEMKVLVRLLLYGRHDLVGAMPYVEDANTSGKIDVGVAIDIGDQGPLGLGDDYRRNMKDAGWGMFSHHPHQLPAPGPRDLSSQDD